MGRISKAVATQDFDRSWTGCHTRCCGLYLHLRRRPMDQKHAPLHLPGTSRLYGAEAKELVLAPVGLARHLVTKLDPLDHLAHPSCPLGPWRALASLFPQLLDAAPQMTQWTSWLCSYVGGQEIDPWLMGSSFCVWSADHGTLAPALTSCATSTTIASRLGSRALNGGAPCPII
jgi:hypothetical protein